MQTLFDQPASPAIFYATIEELMSAVKKATSLAGNYSLFVETRDYLATNKDQILTLLQSKKVAELNNLVYKRPGDTKEDLIKRLYQGLRERFTLDKTISYMPFSETYEEALIRILDSVTEEYYNKWYAERQAQMQETKKAIESPETLAEFRTFLDYRKYEDLTSEKKALYDSLVADNKTVIKQKEQQRAAEVAPIETDAEMIIKQSHHAKKDIPLWVVVLNKRVERPEFEQLRDRAKKFDGYYSSYKGNGAIPGFTFESEEAAKLFTQIDEKVSAAPVIEAIKQERKETTADKLRSMAEKLEENGNEELSRDRQDNTARRARFAAHAEEKAEAQIKFAQTLRKIADGIDSGTVKYLAEIKNATELDQLNSLLSNCKYRYARANNLRHDEIELIPAMAEHAEFPMPRIWKSNGLSTLAKLANESGKKLAAARMIKRLNACKEDTYTVKEYDLDDYDILFCRASYLVGKWELERYKNDLLAYKRVKRLGIDSIEQLRAALRELIVIKTGAGISAEQKREKQLRELERKFIGAKIPGFFPTPDTLAAEVVELAEIEEGHKVLEPSAGLGHLADAIPEGAEIECVEYMQSLAEALKIKGYAVNNTDFLEVEPRAEYDRVVMNPPFEDLQDIDHVTHAFKFLKPGGKLVAIMANNKNGDREKIKQFNSFVSAHGWSQQNEPGAFQSAFRPTGVSTITVILERA
jgi:phospholipid N-methyltransferase